MSLNLCALNLELFSLPSDSEFLQDHLKLIGEKKIIDAALKSEYAVF